MCNINSSNKNFDHRNDTMLHRQDIRQTTRSHRRHMARAQTSITINGSYPTVNVHQDTSSSNRIINNRRRKHPSASVAARRIPSPHLQNYAQSPTDHAPTRTKARGNHRTHPQEITIYNNTNIRKIKPHRIARRRIPRLPHPMKTIKNNLHHRT